MKQFVILTFLIILIPLNAQQPDQENAPPSPKETALDQLFSAIGNEETFPEALKHARKSGIHPQALLEIRFLHCVELRDNAAIAALAKEFLSMKEQFDPDNSKIFALKNDWLGVTHYTQALAALQKNDKVAFKKHITEAFWLSPKQGQAFAPHIEELRLKEAMATVTLDPNRKLKDQETGKPTSIGSLLADKKALLLHFWSPMSQEAQINMPDFVLTTEACNQHNIVVASVLTGQYPDALKDAESIRKEDGAKAACTWLIDSDKKSLSNKLMVTSIPTMVIVSPDGKILFNGQPSNKNFWSALKKIAPGFKRPNSENHNHNHPNDDHAQPPSTQNE